MSTPDAYKVERARLLKVLGENLCAERKRRDLSQEALAQAASLHRNAIGIIERGACEPGLLTVLVLADTLEVSINDLTEGVPTPRERRPQRIQTVVSHTA